MKFAPLPWRISQHDLPEAVGSNQTMTDDFNCSDDLNRLLSAAVVNRRFRRRLLQSPQMAVAEGYDGYSFDLSSRELEVVYTVRAVSLADFARQLIGQLQQTSSMDIAPVQSNKVVERVSVAPLQFASELL